MTTKGERSDRASRSRRNGGRRAVVPALAALLVPVLNAGPAAAAPAAAAPAAIPRTAPAAVSTDVPAPLPVTGSVSAGLVLKTVIYNNQVAALQQRQKKLTAEKQTLAKAAASYNSRSGTYNAKDAACAARVQSHNQKMDAHNAAVDAYNATDHDFVLPAEEPAYEAAEAEKEQLDAEGTALSEETASINGEQQQLDTEEAQLSSEKTQLATDMTNHNERSRTWTSDRQRLETLHQQLLGQMVTALQELLDTPPTQAAAMAHGGDATQPPDPAGQPTQAPGGDPDSRSGQVASISHYAVTNAVPVRFQPVVARLSPGAMSNISASDAAQLTLTTTYDGLLPEENGHYRAIRIQSADTAADTDTDTDTDTSTGTGTDRARNAFDNVLAQGGQATTTVGGRPAVIDRTITVPADDRTKDPCSTGAGFTGSSIVYLPRHKQAGECVASGAYAQLDAKNYTKGPRPGLGFALPGLLTLPYRNRARGHLIGFAMGGSNNDTRNFVPLYQTANQWMYTHAEGPVVKAIKTGGHVYVESYPTYGDPNSAVPTSIDYHTQGDVEEECVIENNPTGAGSYCRSGS